MTTDELESYGVVPMTDDEIVGFLSSQGVGVLALPTDGAPSMRPMSFWFDGADRLYFLYVVGEDSRKADLSNQADAARFLVYRAETRFNWRSVLLTGTIDAVSAAERDAVEAAMEVEGRPEVLEQAMQSAETQLYEFRIEELTGFKHLGLPSGFESATK